MFIYLTVVSLAFVCPCVSRWVNLADSLAANKQAPFRGLAWSAQSCSVSPLSRFSGAERQRSDPLVWSAQSASPSVKFKSNQHKSVVKKQEQTQIQIQTLTWEISLVDIDSLWGGPAAGGVFDLSGEYCGCVLAIVGSSSGAAFAF